MLHSGSFKEIVKRNKNYKDIGFKFAAVAVFVRRVLDMLGLYSRANIENSVVSAIKDDEEFEIVVDRANNRIVLETDLWTIDTRAFAKKAKECMYTNTILRQKYDEIIVNDEIIDKSIKKVISLASLN